MNLIRAFLFFVVWLMPIVALAGVVLESGGSNYIAIGLNLEELNTESDFKNSQIFKTPACHFHAYKRDVYNELKKMRGHGQHKIAFMLWHTRIVEHVDCSGFVLRSNNGAFSHQVMENISQLIQLVTELGFDEVQIRFAPMGRNWPKEWGVWEETIFQENWAVIQSTVAAIDTTTKIRIMFDLGVELGGLTAPGCAQCPEYARRMWQEFTKEYGSDHSYGFSIAYAPERLARLIEVLRTVGPLPEAYAIDIYSEPDKIGADIATLVNEANRYNIYNPMILIQETYYADRDIYRAIINAVSGSKIKIRAIMQWPQIRGSMRRHIGVPATPIYEYWPTQ